MSTAFGILVVVLDSVLAEILWSLIFFGKCLHDFRDGWRFSVIE